MELHFSFYPKFEVNEENSPKQKLQINTFKVDENTSASPSHLQDIPSRLETDTTEEPKVKIETSEETQKQNPNTDIQNELSTATQPRDEDIILQISTEQQSIAQPDSVETLSTTNSAILTENIELSISICKK